MQIKTWQKALVLTSVLGLIAYLQRQRIKNVVVEVKNSILNNLKEFANRWKGVQEIGFNKSFQDHVFQQMLQNVGWISGQAWCMYFEIGRAHV